MAQVSINNGTTCMLWDDLWEGEVPSQMFPELFSFAKDKHLTFAQATNQSPLHSLFNLPLSL
jgi:hypothetical protein